MAYYNENDGFYYTDAEFTTPASGYLESDHDNQSYYFIYGELTTLDENGTGYWNSEYWIQEIITTLDENGTGFEESYYYAYFINGVQTTLNESGSGSWEGDFYINGEIYVYEGGPVNLTSGLEAFYKLSDTSDSSGNNRTLTNNGNGSFASGKIGNAAVFDGSSDLQFDLNLSNLNECSASFWFMWDSNIDGSNILNGPIQAYVYPSDSFSIKFSEEGNTTVLSNLTTNVWRHCVIVGNSLGKKVFIDGILVSQDETPCSFVNGTQRIGRYTGFDDQYQFFGKFDAFGIWNRTLNSTEIAALYNSGNGLEEFGSSPVASSSVIIQGNTKFYGKVKFA